MKRSLLSLALMASVMTADAQIGLVKDINPGMNNSYPSRLSVFGKRLVFGADDGMNGYELWATDSTGANAALAYNINPGADNGLMYSTGNVAVTLGKYLYFGADNGTSGYELYKWDGAGQPVMVADIYAGNGSSVPSSLAVMNGKLYFNADDGINGEELWVYDTATNNAMRLSNIDPLGSSVIRDITPFNGQLFFKGYNPATGLELYKYDPATNNTTLVMDIESGVQSSNPTGLKVLNNRLYFVATTTGFGDELFEYTTTVKRVTDIDPGVGFGVLNYSYAALGDFIYISGNDGTTYGHLYKYDPGTGVTTLVYKIDATGNSLISGITNYAGKLYFAASDGASGIELWRFTGFGTPTMVADIRTGTLGSNPANLTVLNGKLYFSAEDSTNGNELFMFNDSTTSIQHTQFAADVNVYPNPATNAATLQMNLQHSETLQVKMTDMQGRIVYNTNVVKYAAGENKVTLPMASLATGTYLYVISNESGNTLHAGRVQKQ